MPGLDHTFQRGSGKVIPQKKEYGMTDIAKTIFGKLSLTKEGDFITRKAIPRNPKFCHCERPSLSQTKIADHRNCEIVCIVLSH
jgi:hypothetical protein